MQTKHAFHPVAVIPGTPGDDTLTGTAGDDTLDGGLGADEMSGGDGADTYIVDNVGDVVIEGKQPGLLNDRVVATVDYTLPDNVENLLLGGTADLNGTGNSGTNTLVGNAGANRLMGGGGSDSLNGLDGNDWLEGGSDGFNDELNGGAGNDTLIGGAGHDSLDGGAGDDRLVIVEGTAEGGDGNDVLQGTDGNGYGLFGGAGNDTVVGGTLVGSDPSLSGGDGDDLMIARIGVPLRGDAGNDTLQGSSGGDVLEGGTGTDLVDGHAGADVFIDSDNDADTFVGGAGDDTLRMDLSSRDSALVFHNQPGAEQQLLGNTISGIDGYWFTLGAGNDLIDNKLGSGSDSLIGGAGNDRLYAGDNRDTLDGGVGSDLLDGGAGGDRIADTDADRDTLLGGAGKDTLEADWQTVESDIVWKNDGGSAMDVAGQHVGGFESLWLTLGSGNDVVRNDANGRDEWHGQFGNDSLDSAVGDDALYGDEGNDTLIGGAGDDLLQGVADSDVLYGGAGSDTLYGGVGDDRFMFGAADAADALRDFKSKEDSFVVMQSLLPVGDGDLVVEGAQTVASPSSHAAAAELVIATANIKGSITAEKAAAAIGNATDSYAEGQTALFVVDNGKDSAVYHFESSGADAVVSAGELTLLATLETTKATVADDYVFGV